MRAPAPMQAAMCALLAAESVDPSLQLLPCGCECSAAIGVCSACRAVVFTAHTHSATVLRQGERRIRRSEVAYRLCCAYAQRTLLRDKHYRRRATAAEHSSSRLYSLPPTPPAERPCRYIGPRAPGAGRTVVRNRCVSRPCFAGRGAPEAVGDEDVGPLVAPVLEAHLAVVWTI